MTTLPTNATVMRGEEGSTLDAPDKRVFTIFCHGTGGHRDGKCQELITEFGGAYWSTDPPEARGINMKPDGKGHSGHGASNTNYVSDFYKAHYQRDFLILDGVGGSDMLVRSFKGKKLVEGEMGVAGPPNPQPGDFDPFDLNKPLKALKGTSHGSAQKMVSTTGTGVLSLKGKNRGDIHGDGWNDNVAHTLFVLSLLRKEDVDHPEREVKVFPKVINAIGWSRGAVTTIKLAYWINKYFVEGQPFKIAKGFQASDQNEMIEYFAAIDAKYLVPEGEIEVNVFAIDPVPGRMGKSGTWGGASQAEERFPTVPGEQDYRELPSIVNNCIVTLAVDERRGGFYPIDAEKQFGDNAPHLKVPGTANGRRPNVVWLPYPGIHRTQLRLTARDPATSVDSNMRLKGESEAAARDRIKQSLTAVPRLVWDLAWKFLRFHGTEFQRDLFPLWGGPLDGPTICALFDEVGRKRELYHTTRNRGIGAKGAGGEVYRGFTGYTRTNNAPLPFDSLFTDKLGDYVRGRSTQFINEHHRALMKAVNFAEYALRQSDATNGKFQSQWLDSESGEWTNNPAFDRSNEWSTNPAYDPTTATDVVDTETARENEAAEQLVGGEPEGPSKAVYPRKPSAATFEAIFDGRVESMKRSQRFDARWVPVPDAKNADGALFVEVLGRLGPLELAALTKK